LRKPARRATILPKGLTVGVGGPEGGEALMRIATAAYPIDWHNRWNDYVGKLRVWVRTAAEGGANLMVFPEYGAIELASLAGEENSQAPARVVEALSARLKDVDGLHASLAREFGAHILAATGPMRAPNGRIAHRARFFAPDGGRGAQDKVVLDAEACETWGYDAPGAPVVMETELGLIGVLIGSDLEAPEIAAAMRRGGAEILLAPGRAGTPEAAAALYAAAAARARETGCVVVQAMAIGDADWCPAIGRCTGSAGVFGPEALRAEPGDGPDAPLVAGKADTPGWVRLDIEPMPDIAPAIELDAETSGAPVARRAPLEGATAKDQNSP
jgi:predicted amidohydrolase